MSGMIQHPLVEKKVHDIINSFKKQGYKRFSAREISVCLNMGTQRASSYLKMSDRVKYNGKEWVIL